MAEKYFQALGRRKTAVAQARITAGGKGVITVNGKTIEEFFTTEALRRMVMRPLAEVGKTDNVDITVRTSGGGMIGQADATRLAIARALLKLDIGLRPALKAKHMLTRDPRKKERKKPGKHGARRSPQWRKR